MDIEVTPTAAQAPVWAPVAGLPFTGPFLLAPMDGVTEPCFRDLVLARNSPESLGGAFTEFVRVVDIPMPKRVLARALGPTRFPAPVGLQLMGSDLEALAGTVRRAIEVGAPILDLNFGCPSKGALRGCAGSALLDDPRRLEAVVATCVKASAESGGDVPVTAKIRAGGDDDAQLEELARAAEAGGAKLLSVHCRTRAEAYRDTADWARLERAVGAVSIPVCGNGGISEHADLGRMLATTGCRFAMVGRAALGNPWIFEGTQVERDEAARFLLDYAERLGLAWDKPPAKAAPRIKQLLVHWTAGDLVGAERQSWLREKDSERLLSRLRTAAGV